MPSRNISRFSPLFHLSLLWCSLAHRMYYRRFEVLGRGNIPAGKPVIFAACHQNALMDALAVIFAARRQIVFLARADIFNNKFMACLLRFLRILPVYRLRDGYSSLGQNEETFEEVHQVLKQRIPVGIFPEGLHLGMKKLKPLRKGIARIALQAEMTPGPPLNLQIVPVGIDYSEYHQPGADLLVIFGKPLNVDDYTELYRQSPVMAINNLRDDLSDAMRNTMIDIRQDDAYDEILQAAENYAEGEIKKQRHRDNLCNRFFLKKQITERLNRAYQKDPLNFRELCDEMSSRIRHPQEMTSRSVFRFRSGFQILLLFLLLPLFLYGFILNSIPFLLTMKITGRVRDRHFLSSFRFGAGFLLFNLWYFLMTLLIIFSLHNIVPAFALIISLPLSAMFSFYYFRSFRKLFR